MIKRFTVIIALLSSMMALANFNADAQQLNEAASAYLQGYYERAITLYEAQVDSGFYNAKLRINLGHAYFMQRDYGRALLNYRAAQALQPRDDTLQQQIVLTRARASQIHREETDLLTLIADATRLSLSIPELGWLSFGLWCGLFILFSLHTIIKRAQDVQRLFLGAYLVIFFVTFSLFANRIYVETQRPAAVVIDEAVAVYSGPSDDYLQLYTLTTAAEVRILDEVNGWLRFVLPDGREGWIIESAVGYITSDLG